MTTHWKINEKISRKRILSQIRDIADEIAWNGEKNERKTSFCPVFWTMRRYEHGNLKQ
jgi:hypothetical protein